MLPSTQLLVNFKVSIGQAAVSWYSFEGRVLLVAGSCRGWQQVKNLLSDIQGSGVPAFASMC